MPACAFQWKFSLSSQVRNQILRNLACSTRRRLLVVIVWAVLSLLAMHAPAQDTPPTPTVLASFYGAHPRLLLHDNQIPALKERIAHDHFAQEEFKNLQSRANALLGEPPCTYDLHKVEPSLLWVAREVESRVLTLSGMYRLTGDGRYANRAILEMEQAASFPDWNPSHFLDTAEMTAALGIGYDWLYPVMPEHARQKIRDAIIRLGIDPFLARLDAREVHYYNNWVQVVYGGETVGALAIAETSDSTSMKRAEKIVSFARPAMTAIMRLFAPDGGFEEGPSYWNYATAYNILYIDALDSAVGTDYGASEEKGFPLTPDYRIHSLGPTLEFANFGDAHSDAAPAPQMFWFARRFNRSDLSAEEIPVTEHMRYVSLPDNLKPTTRFQFLGLLWYGTGPKLGSAARSPELYQSFARVQNIYMRTAWNDRNAWYVAVRGGSAAISHSHLDLGSFILDADGQRWGLDLGPDSYQLPDYFGQKRWNYFRTQSLSHNTLTVNGRSELPTSHATIRTSGKVNDGRFVTMDLGSAYPDSLATWTRGFLLKDQGGLLVQDDLAAVATAQIVWHFHTRAAIVLAPDGRSARLEQEGKSLDVHLVEPLGARFVVDPCTGGPGEADNSGIRDLAIHFSLPASQGRVAVWFGSFNPSAFGALTNIDAWR